MRSHAPRRLVGVVILLLAAAAPAFAAPTSDELPPRPAWCQQGFVCVPTGWLAERTARVWELRADLARERAKVKRVGWVLGCGPSIAGVVTDELDAKAIPAISCGAIYGWRLSN